MCGPPACVKRLCRQFGLDSAAESRYWLVAFGKSLFHTFELLDEPDFSPQTVVSYIDSP